MAPGELSLKVRRDSGPPGTCCGLWVLGGTWLGRQEASLPKVGTGKRQPTIAWAQQRPHGPRGRCTPHPAPFQEREHDEKVGVRRKGVWGEARGDKSKL